MVRVWGVGMCLIPGGFFRLGIGANTLKVFLSDLLDFLYIPPFFQYSDVLLKEGGVES